jgi:hypothetical protein
MKPIISHHFKPKLGFIFPLKVVKEKGTNPTQGEMKQENTLAFFVNFQQKK